MFFFGIEDDGIGFEVGGNLWLGLGLVFMWECVVSFGGILEVGGKLDGGMWVVVKFFVV